MRTVNKIVLVGNAGRDPEVRETASGQRVANVSLATNTPRDDGTERTDWHRLTFWGRLVPVVERLVRKGSALYVEGRMTYDSYERDGVTYPTADVLVTELIVLNGKEG